MAIVSFVSSISIAVAPVIFAPSLLSTTFLTSACVPVIFEAVIVTKPVVVSSMAEISAAAAVAPEESGRERLISPAFLPCMTG